MADSTCIEQHSKLKRVSILAGYDNVSQGFEDSRFTASRLASRRTWLPSPPIRMVAGYLIVTASRVYLPLDLSV
jgi:hypothetical protein